MISVHPQYIKDTAGKNLVILPEEEFDSLMEELDDMEDERLYAEAKKREQVFTDAETVFERIEAKRKNNV